MQKKDDSVNIELQGMLVKFYDLRARDIDLSARFLRFAFIAASRKSTK
jgi:hypothetical protein